MVYCISLGIQMHARNVVCIPWLVVGLISLTNLTTNRIAELKVQPTDRNVDRNSYESGAGLSGQSLNVKKRKQTQQQRLLLDCPRSFPFVLVLIFYAKCFVLKISALLFQSWNGLHALSRATRQPHSLWLLIGFLGLTVLYD